jgi:hypothetical protein
MKFYLMNRFFYLAMIICFASSCTKTKTPVSPPPNMKYTNLHDSAVGHQHLQRLDLDGNGTYDYRFSTTLIGDPILKQDRLVFAVVAQVNCRLLAIDNSDSGKQMQKGEVISTKPPKGYDWFDVLSVFMTEKIIPESSEPFWQGDWKDASHVYLPVQIKANGLRYNGWIELSVDKANERIVLHQAAISTEAEKDVIAGY